MKEEIQLILNISEKIFSRNIDHLIRLNSNKKNKNYNKLKKEIVEFKPEIIFHLAAQSIVGTSYKDTIGTINTNVIGVANILDICKIGFERIYR